jgi:hypothetical protein
MDARLSSGSASKGATLGVAFLLGSSHAARPQKPLAAPLRELLLNTALLAASRGMDDAVNAIRPVLLGLGMDHLSLHVALALVKLRCGDSQACLAWLEEEVLTREPGHELALAVQASAWRQQGQARGREQANALLGTSTNPLARAMARAAM